MRWKRRIAEVNGEILFLKEVEGEEEEEEEEEEDEEEEKQEDEEK
ncbi:hypothetical protein E2C01_100240 [Portunus trituberculatus]|uniref:Uncharacterized protein n=1 Tax=Portunus trituberculatus TaxID=210409 RepID=A0A5B7KCI0_PORTR|nr:hypothetical protein [Portunus trituberculatus]